MTTNGNVPSTWDEARQLGQLFMMGFDGTGVNDEIRLLIEKYHVGSILLTAKNLESAAQTTQLVCDLQALANNAGHPVPLFIVVDQENGGVNSLYDETHIRQFPSAMGMAATGNKQLAKYIARATAQELSSCGINWILGPVLDVLTDARTQPLGVRSFGEDPVEVSAYGVEHMKGYQEGGLATCGKHFPSYGNLEFFGSPFDVPTITDSLEHLGQTALVPFRDAIVNGIDAIMVGGVAMTSDHLNVMHACLSEQICRDLLRHQMKFNGVIVSECLEMEALSRNIGISGGTVMAFKAGCDLILTCRSLSVQEEAINGLKAGLDNGMFERYRLQESVQRILALKSHYTSWEKAFNPPGLKSLMRLQPMNSKLSTSAYNSSISVVRDTNGYLPLSNLLASEDELLLLTPLVKPLPASAAFRRSGHEDRAASLSPRNHHQTRPGGGKNEEMVFQGLGRCLAQCRNGRVLHTSYTSNGVRPQHEDLLERAKAVVVVTADAGRNKYQHAFAKHISILCQLSVGRNGLLATKPCVVVAVSSPFDFSKDTSIGTYICTYDFTEAAFQALARVLHDDIKLTGSFPGPVSSRRASHARQQWLVETYQNDRDSKALDLLLKNVSDHSKSTVLNLATASTFMLQMGEITEAHFVVRNSTTKELLGFCATYYLKANGTGQLGAIIVDPARRRQSIGHSLHDRAMKALSQNSGITKIRLGSRIPNVYLGIPKDDHAGYTYLRQWLSNLGWDLKGANHVGTMVIDDLATWTSPEGLGQALTTTGVKYDLVHGMDYADSILSHVRQNAGVDVQAMYQIALDNKEGSAIIRAKRAIDGGLLATILIFRNESKLGQFVPRLRTLNVSTGGIGYAVLCTEVPDKTDLLQGLILLGVRQLKKQGIASLYLDYVDNLLPITNLQTLGFRVAHSFDTINSDIVNWSTW